MYIYNITLHSPSTVACKPAFITDYIFIKHMTTIYNSNFSK